MKKFRIGLKIKVISALLILAGLLSFSERKMGDRDEAFSSINVFLHNNEDNHYLDESDVMNTVTQVFEDEGAEVNLKVVENKLFEIPYIANAEVYRDLKNNVIVNVELRRPMARLIRKDKSHAYISYDGFVLPVSSKYTSRVPLISGPYANAFNRENMFAIEDDQQVFALLNSIDQDDFFRAQIAQIDIDAKMNIKMYPQVTKQIVEFGKPVEIEEKFRKLKIFYRQILPMKGWNSYSRVNVRFKGQIVAE